MQFQMLKCLLAIQLVICLSYAMPLNSARLLTTWRIQSNSYISDHTGNAISTPGYNASSWYSASVPCTVLGCLLQLDNNMICSTTEPPDSVYVSEQDVVFFSHNLATIDPLLFNVSWWYRTEFQTNGAFRHVQGCGRARCCQLLA